MTLQLKDQIESMRQTPAQRREEDDLDTQGFDTPFVYLNRAITASRNLKAQVAESLSKQNFPDYDAIELHILATCLRFEKELVEIGASSGDTGTERYAELADLFDLQIAAQED